MKPVIRPNVPMRDYVMDAMGVIPTLSASIAHILLVQSPLHAKWAHPRLSPDYQEDNAKRADIGSAAHEMLVGGEARIVEIAADSYRTNAAKEARDAAYAEGKIPILSERIPKLHAMVKTAQAFLADSEIAKLLLTCEPEMTVLWQEMFVAEAGSMKGRKTDRVWCRARPDWLTKDRRWHFSYKTTLGSAEPEAWVRNHLTRDGHDLAAAFYEQGIGYAGGNSECETLFVIQEQEPPFACSLVGLSPAMREIAKGKVNRAINLWARGMQDDKWPCYPNRVFIAEPMPWDLTREQEMIAREAHDPELGGQA